MQYKIIAGLLLAAVENTLVFWVFFFFFSALNDVAMLYFPIS